MIGLGQKLQQDPLIDLGQKFQQNLLMGLGQDFQQGLLIGVGQKFQQELLVGLGQKFQQDLLIGLGQKFKCTLHSLLEERRITASAQDNLDRPMPQSPILLYRGSPVDAAEFCVSRGLAFAIDYRRFHLVVVFFGTSGYTMFHY